MKIENLNNEPVEELTPAVDKKKRNNLRTNSRIVAMMVLFNQDINKRVDEKLNEKADHYQSVLDMVYDNTESNREEDLKNSEKSEYDHEMVEKLVNGVNEHLADIDYHLSVAIEKYTLDRLSFVDRSLLRIGAYEILYTDTFKGIVINDIVNISKIYSEVEGYKTSKFNNAILDKINK